MADDFGELLRLSRDLSGAAGNVVPFARQALTVTATSIKQEWRGSADRRGLAGYAADITYETRVQADSVVAEVGPTANGDQGAFGFVEDAPGGVRSAPQHAGRDALESNADDFERGLEIAVSDALREAGL